MARQEKSVLSLSLLRAALAFFFLRVHREKRVRFSWCSTLETGVLRSTLLAVVSSFAPSATNKVNKLHVLGQLGLVGEERKKLDDDFFI